MSDVKNQENISVESEQELSEILKIRREKLAALQEKGKNPFAITTSRKDTDAADIVDSFDELEGKDVVIAGRMMSWRNMGKASFMDLRDYHRNQEFP